MGGILLAQIQIKRISNNSEAQLQQWQKKKRERERTVLFVIIMTWRFIVFVWQKPAAAAGRGHVGVGVVHGCVVALVAGGESEGVRARGGVLRRRAEQPRHRVTGDQGPLAVARKTYLKVIGSGGRTPLSLPFLFSFHRVL